MWWTLGLSSCLTSLGKAIQGRGSSLNTNAEELDNLSWLGNLVQAATTNHNGLDGLNIEHVFQFWKLGSQR